MSDRGGNRGILIRTTGVGAAFLLFGAAVVFWRATSGNTPDQPEITAVAHSMTSQPEASEPGLRAPPAEARSDSLALDALAGSIGFDDGLPCRGGRVEITTASGWRSHSPTDDYGRFSLQTPREDASADIEVIAPGTVPLHEPVDLSALPRDSRHVRTIHLRALRHVTIHVTVEIDPSIESWIDSTHRVRLAIRRVSLFSPNGLESVSSSGMQTVPIRGTDWPITFTADEDHLRSHRGWVVSCDLAARWPVHWCEVPVVLAAESEEQSTASVRIRLDASHVLRGTITSEEGLPLQSGRVVFERSGAEAAFCYSEPDGGFLLPVPGDSDGHVFVEFGSARADLGPRSPGDNLGVVTVPVPECIRVRLVDAQRRPITAYVAGYSNLFRRPSDLASSIREHPQGVVVLRSSVMSRGNRLFFEGDFGQMVFEAAEELRGGKTPIEIIAAPAPTGNLRVEGEGLSAGSTSVQLREARTARRLSANRSYLTSIVEEGGFCILESIVTGDYEYTLRAGRSTVARGFVRIHEGNNELTIR